MSRGAHCAASLVTAVATHQGVLHGANVKTDWKVGSRLIYSGEYQGKPYEEKGVIKQIEPEKILQATHSSKSSGKQDKPSSNALTNRFGQALAHGSDRESFEFLFFHPRRFR